MNLKIIENFDANFELTSEAKTELFSLLTNEQFITQISKQTGNKEVEFTELLFQPIPYTINTPKGMPKEFEPYHESEDHIIINVPPHFMFKAKIFKPSRLCAIYRKISQ